VLAGLGPDLRRVLHEQLGLHLEARGIHAEKLDFSMATRGGRAVRVHGGTATDLRRVRALGAGGRVLLEDDVEWLRDEMAEEFRVFFGRTLPAHVLASLDVGVRRRLAEDPRWGDDPGVRAGIR
jgi:hypothetical protein